MSPRPERGRTLTIAISLCLFLLLLVVAGCRGRVTEDTPPTPAQVADTRPPAAPTVLQTAAPTATSSPAATASPTIEPSPTSLPSPTPSPTPCISAGAVISVTYPSRAAGADQAARIYLPPCHGVDRHVYPTLYLFAGNIHDESKWDELGVDEAADRLIAAGELPPLLIVMADGGQLANNTSGGPGSYETLVLDELLPYVEETTCAWADPAGRAIGGLSRGGYWALEIAFRFPDRFTSVGGHSAALLDQFAGPDVNPQQTALTHDLGQLRIYLDIGADDYLRANTIRLHEDMAARGIPHTWVLQEGRHEDAYWAAHVADYLRWYGEPWPSERDAYPLCTNS